MFGPKAKKRTETEDPIRKATMAALELTAAVPTLNRTSLTHLRAGSPPGRQHPPTIPKASRFNTNLTPPPHRTPRGQTAAPKEPNLTSQVEANALATANTRRLTQAHTCPPARVIIRKSPRPNLAACKRAALWREVDLATSKQERA